MPPAPGIARRLWYRWKSLNLPWRRQFLIGADLSGNTFWTFRDPNFPPESNRWRRIVKYSRKAHYADVKISPQWHQWLRHTRDEAPSLQEQQYDVSRQEMMKVRAREADERWSALPSYKDKPQLQQAQPAVEVHEPLAGAAAKVEGNGSGVTAAVGDQEEVREAVSEETDSNISRKQVKKGREPGPWDRADKEKDKWEPASWIPGVAQRR